MMDYYKNIATFFEQAFDLIYKNDQYKNILSDFSDQLYDMLGSSTEDREHSFLLFNYKLREEEENLHYYIPNSENKEEFDRNIPIAEGVVLQQENGVEYVFSDYCKQLNKKDKESEKPLHEFIGKKLSNNNKVFFRSFPFYNRFIFTFFYEESASNIEQLAPNLLPLFLYNFLTTNMSINDRLEIFNNLLLEGKLSNDKALYNDNKMHLSTIKSAISAIMSRNMSHNIGSHVLSAVGNKSVSASDDRILFRYLQNRMDYIALVSTEMPQWTSSTWFINDMMKNLYSQKHLLEYIGLSEGLSYYNWGEGEENKKNGIKINVMINGISIIGCGKKDDDEHVIGCKENDGSKKPTKITDSDFQLAIPGGPVGAHAFYTILENFIRNTAKHDWSKNEKSEDNLNITINCENEQDKDYVLFTIYDSQIDSNEEKPNHNYNNNNNDEDSDKPIHVTINEKLEKGFLDESGELRKEDWGLAEMKISCGFLNIKSYYDIGKEAKEQLFSENEGHPSGLIKAVGYCQEKDRECNPNPDKCNNCSSGKCDCKLAYQFAIPKPKEILFLDKESKTFECFNKPEFKKQSIYVNEDDKNYDIIVMAEKYYEKAEYENNKHLFPNRIFIASKEENLSKSPPCIKKSDISDIVAEKEGKGGGELKRFLWKKWIEHLLTIKGHDQNIKFHVELKGSDSNSNDVNRSKIDKSFIEYMEKEGKDYLIKLFPEYENDCENFCDAYIKFIQETGQKDIFENDRGELKADFKSKLDPNMPKNYYSAFNKKIKQYRQEFKHLSEKLIFQYEEHIKTLPKIYKHDTDNVLNIKDPIEKNLKIFENKDFKFKFKEKINPEKMTDDFITYSRHFDSKEYDGFVNNEKYRAKKSIYSESLSGSQVSLGLYLNILNKEGHESMSLTAKMIENALIDVTVFDERVWDYKEQSELVMLKYKYANINVIDGYEYKDNKDYIGIKGRVKKAKNAIIKSKKGDIFIVHQGILDKNFDNTKEQNEFIENLKKNYKWVFVTSGRGKPDKLPEQVKFLPFSVVRAYLMKNYPEKILLINILMKIAGGKKSG